jgi:Fic family protein
MPPDWDADSPELRRNLAGLLQSIEEDARQRKPPSVESARHWQSEIMRNLQADEPKYIGAFRGEAGLENVQVHVNGIFGVAAPEVAAALRAFEQHLQSVVAYLDNTVLPDTEPNADQTAAIVAVCAWAHAEWVRIHPFANGNGRTARLWANSLAMRYGLPPFVGLRPRPEGDYGLVSALAMRGDWEPTVAVFLQLLEDFRMELDPDTYRCWCKHRRKSVLC